MCIRWWLSFAHDKHAVWGDGVRGALHVLCRVSVTTLLGSSPVRQV